MRSKIVSLPGMALVKDDKIWISQLEVNGLVQIDLQTGIADFIGSFMKEQVDYMLHYHITSYYEKIFFLSWNGANISIYDTGKKEFRNIEIPKKMQSEIGRIYTSISKDNYLYLMSETASAIIEFDMINEQIIDCYVPTEKLENDTFSVNMKPYLFQEYIWKIDKKSAWRFHIYSKRFERQELWLHEKVKSVCDSEHYVWIVTEGMKVHQYTKDGSLKGCYELNDYLKGWQNANHCIESVFLGETLLLVFHDNQAIMKIPMYENRLKLDDIESRMYEYPFFSIQKNAVTIFEENDITLIDNTGERNVSIQNTTQVAEKIMEARCWKIPPVLSESNDYTIRLDTYMNYIMDKE